jgi:hypothetical protein
MSDIKTQYHNELLIKIFISMFGINPEFEKNKLKTQQLTHFERLLLENFSEVLILMRIL